MVLVEAKTVVLEPVQHQVWEAHRLRGVLVVERIFQEVMLTPTASRLHRAVVVEVVGIMAAV